MKMFKDEMCQVAQNNSVELPIHQDRLKERLRAIVTYCAAHPGAHTSEVPEILGFCVAFDDQILTVDAIKSCAGGRVTSALVDSVLMCVASFGYDPLSEAITQLVEAASVADGAEVLRLVEALGGWSVLGDAVMTMVKSCKFPDVREAESAKNSATPQKLTEFTISLADSSDIGCQQFAPEAALIACKAMTAVISSGRRYWGHSHEGRVELEELEAVFKMYLKIPSTKLLNALESALTRAFKKLAAITTVKLAASPLGAKLPDQIVTLLYRCAGQCTQGCAILSAQQCAEAPRGLGQGCKPRTSSR
jgi:hypothetical protein